MLQINEASEVSPYAGDLNDGAAYHPSDLIDVQRQALSALFR